MGLDVTTYTITVYKPEPHASYYNALSPAIFFLVNPPVLSTHSPILQRKNHRARTLYVFLVAESVLVTSLS